MYRTYPNVKFSVTKIGYNDRREIVDLTIVDRFGNVRFLCEGGVQKKTNQGGQGSRQGAQSGRQAQTPPPAAQTSQVAQRAPQGAPSPAIPAGGAVCPVCGGPISDAERDYSLRKYGRELCRKCQRNA